MDRSDLPSWTAGAIVTPSVPICVPREGRTVTLPVVLPGTAGYVPSNVTISSGNSAGTISSQETMAAVQFPAALNRVLT